MECHNPYIINQKTIKITVITGALLFILGLIFLLFEIINPAENNHFRTYIVFIIFILQGGNLFALAVWQMRLKRYYFEWDDEIISYHLLGNKKPEKIKIKDITDVTISINKISFKTPIGIKQINLNNMRFNDLKTIKTLFERLK